jgi:hypothetical protein
MKNSNKILQISCHGDYCLHVMEGFFQIGMCCKGVQTDGLKHKMQNHFLNSMLP